MSVYVYIYIYVYVYVYVYIYEGFPGTSVDKESS